MTEVELAGDIPPPPQKAFAGTKTPANDDSSNVVRLPKSHKSFYGDGVKPPEKSKSPFKLNGPSVTTRGEFPDAVLEGDFEVCKGKDIESKFLSVWTKSFNDGQTKGTRPTTGRDLLRAFVRHEIGAVKEEGEWFTIGKLDGKRRIRQAAKTIRLVVLDFDHDPDVEAMIKKLEAREMGGVFYTTHSHMAKTMSLSKKDIQEWAKRKDTAGLEQDGRKITFERAKRFAIEVMKMPADSILGTDLVGDAGAFVQVVRTPIEKWRFVGFLAEPIIIGADGRLPEDDLLEYAEHLRGFGEYLGGGFDEKCIGDGEPERAFFLPMHAEGNPHQSIAVGGGFINLKDFPRVPNPFKPKAGPLVGGAKVAVTPRPQVKGSGKRDYITPGFQAFWGKIYHKGWSFQAEDFFTKYSTNKRDERREGKKGRHFRCPNHINHTDPDDASKNDCFAVNAFYQTDREGQVTPAKQKKGEAYVQCNHMHCGDMTTGHHIDMQFAEAGGTDLTLLHEYVVGADGEPVDWGKSTTRTIRKSVKPVMFKTVKDAQAAIACLDKGNDARADEIALGIGQMSSFLIGPFEKEKLTKGLAIASGMGVTVARNAVSQARQSCDLNDSNDYAEAMEFFNKIVAYTTVGNKSKVIKMAQGLNGTHTLIDVSTFHNEHAAMKLSIETEKGPKDVAASTIWWGDAGRRNYFEGIKYRPGETTEAEYYNSWHGWSVEPIEGDWSILREHIFSNLCRKNAYYFAFVMCWLADIFQDPQNKKGTGIVLQGGQKTGKSIFGEFIRGLMEHHCLVLSKAEHITRSFNEHLSRAQVVVAEEAFLAENKTMGNIIKDLVTNPMQAVELKGVDMYMEKSFVRILVLTNEERVVWADADERRWFVLRVADAKPKDEGKKYFEKMTIQMRQDGGLEAMLYDLLRLPIPDTIDLRTAPETDELRMQKEHSNDTIEVYVKSILTEGELIIWNTSTLSSKAYQIPTQAEIDAEAERVKKVAGDTPKRVTPFDNVAECKEPPPGFWVGKAALYESYKRATPRDVKAESVFHAKFEKLLPSVEKSRPRTQTYVAGSNGGRVYRFPSLETCIADFEKVTKQTVKRSEDVVKVPSAEGEVKSPTAEEEVKVDPWKAWADWGLGGVMPVADGGDPG